MNKTIDYIQSTLMHPSLRRLFAAVMALGLVVEPLRAQIFEGPASQTVLNSFTAPFGVATLTEATNFQWYFNGKQIPGATDATYYLFNAQQTNAGTYTVQVFGAAGDFTSGPAILTVTNLSFQAPSMQFTTLASLDSSVTGAAPQVGVIQANDNFLYGVTEAGGPDASGTAFKMTTNGAIAWVASFTGNNGEFPVGGLVQAGDGNLYGTTVSGGNAGFGTVFCLTTAGVISNLYSFKNLSTDGGNPEATLCVGTDGFLYGTTSANDTAEAGGSIFKMSTEGALVWSYELTTNTGDVPLAGLVQGMDGGLYGTTSAGGTNSGGTIFRITTNNVGEIFSLLYTFTNGADGSSPAASLVQGKDGQLYGTASGAGKFGYGTIFKITTNASPEFTVLAAFDGTNGSHAEAGLIQAGDGNFYGTTVSAGVEYPLAFNSNGVPIYEPLFGNPIGFGTVFQLTTNGTLTTLFSFDGNDDGTAPHSALWQGQDGGLYGTTSEGGTNDLSISGNPFGDGTVFRIGVEPPTITSAAVHSGSFSFTWNAMPGELYQAQYKDALNQPSWIDLGGLVAGTNGLASQTDTISTNARFYRVMLQF